MPSVRWRWRCCWRRSRAWRPSSVRSRPSTAGCCPAWGSNTRRTTSSPADCSSCRATARRSSGSTHRSTGRGPISTEAGWSGPTTGSPPPGTGRPPSRTRSRWRTRTSTWRAPSSAQVMPPPPGRRWCGPGRRRNAPEQAPSTSFPPSPRPKGRSPFVAPTMPSPPLNASMPSWRSPSPVGPTVPPPSGPAPCFWRAIVPGRKRQSRRGSPPPLRGPTGSGCGPNSTHWPWPPQTPGMRGGRQMWPIACCRRAGWASVRGCSSNGVGAKRMPISAGSPPVSPTASATPCWRPRRSRPQTPGPPERRVRWRSPSPGWVATYPRSGSRTGGRCPSWSVPWPPSPRTKKRSPTPTCSPGSTPPSPRPASEEPRRSSALRSAAPPVWWWPPPGWRRSSAG